MRNFPFSVLGLFLLASCASLSPEQCRNADWRQIGYADGANGAPGSRIQEHASACAKIDAKPDMEAYLAGRMEGLVSYCQPENGFDVGRRGAPDNAGDCPPHVRAAFLQNYRQGREMRRREDRIEDIRKELRRPNVSAERRGSLLGEMERLIDRKQDTGGRQVALQREMDIVQQRLAVRLREMGR